MDAAHLLRTARRMAGLSQRELARRAGARPANVSDIERGAVTPNVATLQCLLAAAGVELSLTRAVPPGCRHLQRYLRLTLTQRLYLTFGGTHRPQSDRDLPGWLELWELAGRARVQVVGDAAVGVWVPVVAQPPTVHAQPWTGQTLPAATPGLVVLPAADPPSPAAIPIGFRRQPVLVLPPDLLAMGAVTPAQRVSLHAAAALLHERSGVDDAGRRPPAHRDVSPRNDRSRVLHTKRFGDLPFPPQDAGRGWQLEGPVSLAQWLRGHGYPT